MHKEKIGTVIQDTAFMIEILTGINLNVSYNATYGVFIMYDEL
jgi:hypothetical protein